MDDNKIENIANNLKKGMHVAADLAEEVGRVAKAKLDVALAKKQIYRKEAELGTFVFENIEKNGALESTEAQHIIKTLIELHGELKEFETALSELRKTSDKTEENQEASGDR